MPLNSKIKMCIIYIQKAFLHQTSTIVITGLIRGSVNRFRLVHSYIPHGAVETQLPPRRYANPLKETERQKMKNPEHSV